MRITSLPFMFCRNLNFRMSRLCKARGDVWISVVIVAEHFRLITVRDSKERTILLVYSGHDLFF